MQYSIIVLDPTTNQQLADHSWKARNVQIDDNALSYDITLRAWEALPYVDNLRVLHVRVMWNGLRRTFRLTNAVIVNMGIRVQALAMVVALEDRDYNEFWSSTKFGEWTPSTNTTIGAYPERFEMDTNNRVYITPRNGAQLDSTIRGIQAWTTPFTSISRSLRVFRFTYNLTAASTAIAQIYRRDAFYTTSTLLWSQQGLGGAPAATKSGTITLCFPASFVLSAELFFNTGLFTYTDQTGTDSFRITAVRMVAATTGVINTTLGTTIAAGVRVCTPASMANITVGVQLTVGTSTTNSMETVTVTAVTATTFTATFTLAHNSTDNVYGFIGLFADEIVKDVQTSLRSLNSYPIAATTALIQTPTADIPDFNAEGMKTLDVLQTLARPIDFVYGVNCEQQLFFYPRGSYARAWAVKTGDIELSRPLDSMWNSTHGAYDDVNGIRRLTSPRTDDLSVIQHGLTRRHTIDLLSTDAGASGVLAERNADLERTKNRPPRVRISLRRIYARDGAEYPADQLQVGDTLTITNLPAWATNSTQLRTFVIKEVAFDPQTRIPTVALEVPQTMVATLLATLGTR